MFLASNKEKKIQEATFINVIKSLPSLCLNFAVTVPTCTKLEVDREREKENTFFKRIQLEDKRKFNQPLIKKTKQAKMLRG